MGHRRTSTGSRARARATAVAAALALPLLAAGIAHGQTQASTQAAKGGPDPKARTAAYIANLKSELHITAAEEGPWSAFAGVMEQNADEISAKMAERDSGFAKMNAVDDLRNYADVSQLHAQEMAKLVAPFETLYGALSPSQKAEADRLFHDTRGQHSPVHG